MKKWKILLRPSFVQRPDGKLKLNVNRYGHFEGNTYAEAQAEAYRQGYRPLIQQNQIYMPWFQSR